MTEQEENIDELIEGLIEMFGDKLPDPVQEPIRFEYYIKLFKYEKTIKKDENVA